MEVEAGRASGWRWAYGTTRHNPDDTIDGLVAAFPIIGLTAAHGTFWFRRDLTQRLVEVCGSEAAACPSIAGITKALDEVVRTPLFHGAVDRFQGAEASLLLLSDDGRVDLAHLGGAGVFIWHRTGTTEQLAEPQTIVDQMVADGRLSADDAADHPHRDVLTTALLADLDPPTPWVLETITLKPADQLVMTTLHLSRVIEDPDGTVLGGPAGVEQRVRSLLELGQRDTKNIGSTVIVVERTSPDQP